MWGGKISEKIVPYHVTLYYSSFWVANDDRYFCGGTIINEYFILTAGHCANDTRKENYRLYIGSRERFGGNLTTIKRIILHEGYKLLDDEVRAVNDIALVELEYPLYFYNEYQHLNYPVPLFDKYEETPVNTISKMVGWGMINSTTYPKVLHSIELPIVSKDDCNKTYISSYGGIMEKQICAGFIDDNDDGMKSMADGDSGSALIVNGRLAGVASWVSEPIGQPKSPGVFTEVAQYRDWIDEKVRHCKKCTPFSEIAAKYPYKN